MTVPCFSIALQALVSFRTFELLHPPSFFLYPFPSSNIPKQTLPFFFKVKDACTSSAQPPPSLTLNLFERDLEGFFPRGRGLTVVPP